MGRKSGALCLAFLLLLSSVVGAASTTKYQMRYNYHTGRGDWIIADESLYGAIAEHTAIDDAHHDLVSLAGEDYLSLSNQQITALEINDDNINWGTGASQVSAEDVPIADSGSWFEDDNVEDALSEAGQHLGFYNGTFHETFDALVIQNGSDVDMTLEQSGGGDLVMRFSDGHDVLDCTDPICSIQLTEGTDSAPQANWIYIPQATKVLTKSTTGFPTDAEHIRVGFFFVPSDSEVGGEGGSYINQNWNDHIAGTDSQGHVSHIGGNIRECGITGYCSGLGGDGDGGTYVVRTAGSPDTVFLKIASGVIQQFHMQTLPARDTSSGDDFHVVNSSVASYEEGSDLYDFLVDADGDSMTNRYYNLILWVVGNKSGQYAPLMINLPTCSYTLQANAETDVSGCDVLTIPREFVLDSNTAHLVARLTMKHSNPNDLELISTVDLRGTLASSVTGGGGSSHDPVTLAGVLDYLSIAGQVITLNSVEDDDLNSSYVLADGTRPLTGDWDVGNFDLTAKGLTLDGESLITYGTAETSRDLHTIQMTLAPDGSDTSTYRGLFVDIDYDATGTGNAPTMRAIDIDVDVTSATAFGVTGGTISNIAADYDSNSIMTSPVSQIITTTDNTSVGLTPAILYRHTALGGSVTSLRTEAKVQGSGTAIGYQGFGGSVGTGTTGELKGVEGFIDYSGSGSTPARVIALSGLPQGSGSGDKPTNDKIMSFKGVSGHALVDRGSLFVRSSSTTDLSSFSSTHLTHTNFDGDGYFEGDLEVDGTLWADGAMTVTGTPTMATNIAGQTHAWDFTILDPSTAYDVDTQIFIGWARAALTITNIQVELDTSSFEVAGDLKHAADFQGLGSATVINDFDTTSGKRDDSTITSASVASGKAVYIQFDSQPNAGISQMHVHIEWDFD